MGATPYDEVIRREVSRELNEGKVCAKHFCKLLAVNVDNEKLDDESFREFVRNTLEIVGYE